MPAKFLCTIVFLFSCITNQAQTLNGRITNTFNNVIYICYSYNQLYNIIDTITANADGRFTKKFQFEKMASLMLRAGDGGCFITMFPDADLDLEADAITPERFNETLVFRSKGINVNFPEIENSPRLTTLNPNYKLSPVNFSDQANEWLFVRDSIRKSVVIGRFKKPYPEKVKEFLLQDSINDRYRVLDAMLWYEQSSLRFWPESGGFYSKYIQPFAILTEEEHHLSSLFYKSFWGQKMYFESMKIINTPDANGIIHQEDPLFTKLDLLEKQLPPRLYQILLSNEIESYSANYTNIHDTLFRNYDSVLNLYGTQLIDQRVYQTALFKVKEYKSIRLMTAKGLPAPAFNLFDSTGKEYTLDSFKGKIIYLDVWASWCSPCIGQFPPAKKLEEKYRGNNNLLFLSASIDATREGWINKGLKKHTPPGLQLWAGVGGWDSQFSKDYFVRGIPKYILIDKEGRIINFDAPRPGEYTAEQILDALLAE
ncbi:MAG: TlpA disulfide reductase family protein [Chitinophagaceae bacterium]